MKENAVIFVLSIEKVAPSIYMVHFVDHGGVEVSEPTQHASVSEALAFYGESLPAEVVQYVEVHYGGVNSGTIAVTKLRSESHQLASMLVAKVVEVAQAHELQKRWLSPIV